MIQADALTNPWTYRHCQHVFEDHTVTPRRCLACRAIDHGPVAVMHVVSLGKVGYRLGNYPFTPPETGCKKGHPVKRWYALGRYCMDCKKERRNA